MNASVALRFGGRLAIRAASIDLSRPHDLACGWNLQYRNLGRRTKKRGNIEGTIRIPLYFLLFLFNDLVFPSISSKSFRFRSVMFSTPTRFRQTPAPGGIQNQSVRRPRVRSKS
jgi:hypothetical protein